MNKKILIIGFAMGVVACGVIAVLLLRDAQPTELVTQSAPVLPQREEVAAPVLPYAYDDKNGFVFRSKLGISWWAPYRMTDPEEYAVSGAEGGMSELATSGGTVVRTISVPYTHVANGLGDWALPVAARDAIIKSASCATLAENSTEGAMLPVFFDANAPCAVSKQADRTVIYGIGYARAFESPATLQSMMVIMQSGQALVVTDVIPGVDKFSDANRAKIDAYVAEHPTMQFADASYTALLALVKSVVTEELKSERVQKDFALLRRMAESVKIE